MSLTGLFATATAEVRWLEKDHDFGLMKEVAGPQTGVSRFVNLGPDTLSIFNVRPSCGCTSAKWSEELIAPGDTAIVSYTYDPHLRPGKFDKSVKVQLSDGSRHSIRITGNVFGTPESLSTLYPFEAGDLRLSEAAVNMGTVKYGHTPIAFVNAYSLATDSVAPTVATDVPGLVVSPSVPAAGPGDLITYTLRLDTRNTGQYGPIEGGIVFTTPGGESKPLPFRAFIEPDPDRLLLAQRGKNPVCELTPDPVDFGAQSADGNRAPITELTVSNPGKGPLDIYRVVCDNQAVTLTGVPANVKAGKKAKIKVSVDPAQLQQGPHRIPLTFITSDPQNPVKTLNIAVYRQ